MPAENENHPPHVGTAQTRGAILPSPSRVAAASAIDLGRVEDGRIIFANWKGEADKPAPVPFAPLPPERRVGVAMLGLGRLALEEILPAFAGCVAARPVALISGSSDKARAVAARYGIAGERVYGYGDWEKIAAGKEPIILTPEVRPVRIDQRQILSAIIGSIFSCECC